MHNLSRWLPPLSIALSLGCLVSYFGTELLGARLVAALFWLSLAASIFSLSLTRPKKPAPLMAAILSWVLLWPVAGSALTWSTWWLGGFVYSSPINRADSHEVPGLGTIQVGQELAHQTFGKGKVQAIHIGDNGASIVNISFPNQEPKWLLAEHANLKLVAD